MLSREGKQTDRGAVGAEFIGYNRRRREALLLQEFPHQPNCRPSVPAGLNQEIQDFALTVHGTPEIELPPSNYDDHLVQVPAFGRSWPPTLNPPPQLPHAARLEAEPIGSRPAAVIECLLRCRRDAIYLQSDTVEIHGNYRPRRESALGLSRPAPLLVATRLVRRLYLHLRSPAGGGPGRGSRRMSILACQMASAGNSSFGSASPGRRCAVCGTVSDFVSEGTLQDS